MNFRILGPLEVYGGNGAVALGGSKPRTVMAVLLLHANEPVSADRLAEALWGEEAAVGAVRTVQVHVSRLRKALGDPEILTTTPAGYCLRVEAGELDAERFATLVEEGRRALAAGRPDAAGGVLREALALWRGPALADLAFEPFAPAEIARLEEQRLAALEARLDADLAAGRHADVVGELRQLVAAEPARERLAGQLMLALYRCGRQTEALAAYADARHTLVDAIGAEPGPELRRLHEAILQQDAALEPPPPAELPPELDSLRGSPLAGREDELAWLRERLDRARGGDGALVTVSGPPGIGKRRLVAELAGEAHELGVEVRHASGAGRANGIEAALARAAGAAHPTLLVIDGADRIGASPAHDVTSAPVLVVATGEDDRALHELGPDGALVLEPLDVPAVARIAALYAPADLDEGVPAEWLRQASGGVPARVHELAGQWARREAARRVGAVAGLAATGRIELRSIEAELSGRVVELQAADQRVAQAGGRDPPVVCPFKGLASFDVADAPYFFGRERVVAELVARLVGAPMLGVVGPSGSGKSSVVRAGLLPALAGGVVPGSDSWTQVLIRPGEHPMGEWRRGLGDLDGSEHAVIAVDQFEETFTACRDERERAAFIAELAREPDRHPGRRVVVLAVRADYYGRCAQYPEIARLLAANHVLVGAMRRDELARAVECPAESVGLRVDPELTAAIVDDVAGQPGALPMLSTALLELWPRRDGVRLRLSAYEQTGGVRGAVARLAEDAFRRLDPAQQAVARDVLMRLVAEGVDGTIERRRVPLGELETERSEDVTRVVELLTDRRLLTVTEGTLEIAHEALLREWPRLRGWVEEDHEGLRIQRGLTAAAQEWDHLDRDEGELYRGARLIAANEWRARRQLPLSRLERDFLDASNARRTAERTARRRRLRLAFAGLILALAAISVVAIVAVRQAREAERQRDIGASRELAAKAMSLLDADPGLSLGLALWALDRDDTEQAENAVRQVTYEARGTGLWQPGDGWLYAARPSRDGHTVVTAGENGMVRIWSLDGGREISAFQAFEGPVYDASLSPDGRRVVSVGGDDGLVVLTDVDGGNRRVLLNLGGSDGPLTGEFSPDGRRLAVAASDGTVRILPVVGGAKGVVLRGHGDEVWSASFDAGGRRVVSASFDGTARIWDVATGRSIVLPHPGTVLTAAFRPDGRQVATGGDDGVVRIWNAADGRRLKRIEVDRHALLWVRYGPDGRRIVTAGEDGTVQLVDVGGASVLRTFEGHRGQVTQAAFVQGGDAIVSAGEDGTMRTWAVDRARVIPGDAGNLSLSADGRYVTGGDGAGGVTVWDLATGTHRALAAHERESVAAFSPGRPEVVSTSWDGIVRISGADGRSSRVVPSGDGAKYSVAFAPDGHRIALGGSNAGPEIVIQSTDGSDRVVLRGHEAAVYDVDFSEDGARLVSASEDGTARIWDARTGRQERVLRGHGVGVRSAEFSADGGRVVTAGADGTVRVWPVGGGAPRVLTGHQGPVLSAAFNQRGDRIVSAGQDGTVRIWDAAGGELVLLHTHDGSASAATFLPDGRNVLSAGTDGLLRVSSCETCGAMSSVLRLARTRADRGLSQLERDRFEPRAP